MARKLQIRLLLPHKATEVVMMSFLLVRLLVIVQLQ